MAIELIDKTNAIAATAEYPYGQFKDNTGSNNGVPLNKAVLEDYLQFFHKMMAESGVVYNDVPDNEYDGWQFFEAFEKLVGRGVWTSVNLVSGDFGGNGSPTFTSGALNYLVTGKTFKCQFQLLFTSGTNTNAVGITLPSGILNGSGFEVVNTSVLLMGGDNSVIKTYLANGSNVLSFTRIPITNMTDATPCVIQGCFECEIQ